MSAPITIHVYPVGQHFGTGAVARQGDRELYRTRVYPYGFDGPAYADCVAALEELGYATGDRYAEGER